MDVKTLQGYAVFLHTRRGELARAEAFFLRALHICLPDFVVWPQQRSQNNVDGMATNSDGPSASPQARARAHRRSQ